MSVFKYTKEWITVTRMAKAQVTGTPAAQVTANYASSTKVGRPG
jgi:predicted nucleic acid-binding Zn ribbon protein